MTDQSKMTAGELRERLARLEQKVDDLRTNSPNEDEKLDARITRLAGRMWGLLVGLVFVAIGILVK